MRFRRYIGIDNGFSFPLSYMRRHGITRCDDFLREVDYRGILDRYVEPPLTGREQRQAALEGWMPGVWSRRDEPGIPQCASCCSVTLIVLKKGL